jgi:asparagine synthase (glutamine-hydrolysing)
VSRRYLVAVRRGTGDISPVQARLRDVGAEAGKFRDVIHTADLHAVVSTSCRPSIDCLGGVIFGSLFARDTSRSIDTLATQAQKDICQSQGEQLIDDFWGGYVAVLPSEDARSVSVVRSPFGDLPCYYVETSDAVILASDIPLLIAATDLRPVVEWQALTRHLIASNVPRSETCLSGIRELRGGQRLTIDADQIAVSEMWSAWICAKSQFSTRAEAADHLRRSVLDSTAAVAGQFDRIVLKLSGGVDSSIVAAALARAPATFSCVTLVTKNPSGDERRYARLVAEAFSAPLQETYRDPAHVDLTRSASAHEPRPTVRSFLQESDRICRTAAAESGAGAIFDGGGGDNVFCSLRSAAPVADSLLSEHPEAGFLQTAKSVARLAQASVWTVGKSALAKAWFKSPAFQWKGDTRFLSRQSQSMVQAAVKHPWLEAPGDALPGKAAQIALFVRAQCYVEGLDPLAPYQLVAPLVTQPVVETCCRAPSWMWFDGGRDRAIARAAFCEELPAEVIWRRSKGTPESFMAELYEANRPIIRELLSEGLLAANDIIDRDALAAELRHSGPVRGSNYVRVMQLLDAEVWARSWSLRPV